MSETKGQMRTGLLYLQLLCVIAVDKVDHMHH